MRYDFDQVIDRSGNLSAKYDERLQKFGRDDVIPLWVADMDFRTAQPIIDALKARAEEGLWGYTARPAGYFEAIRDWQGRRNGWTPDTGLMSFCLGVVQTLSAMVQLYTPQGGNVLIQTPVYGEFYDMAEFAGRRVIENQLVERDGTWAVDWADFEAKLQEADLFLLCSPHNPLGIVWPEADLRRMMELCLQYHVLVVSDEIHSDLVFHGKKHIPAASLSPEIAANVVTGISGTKTFNLAGLQASAVVFPTRHMKENFDRFWMNMDIHRNNAFSVTAMETAFREGEEWLDQLLPYLSENFDFVVDYCEQHIPKIKTYAPDATYLMWLDCRALGLGAYFANLVGEFGPQLLSDYGRSMVVYYPLCLLYVVVFFPLYALFAGGKTGLRRMLKHIFTPAVTAFATQSSAATLPVNKEACDHIGVPKDVSDLVLPMGCTMHMDGSVLSSIVKIAFLFGIFGMPFSGAGTYAMAIAVAILSAFVLSGAPGGGLVGEMLIVSMFGFPAEAFPLIATLGFLFDPAATCLNAAGDTIASMMVTRLVEGKNWLEKKTGGQ